MGRSTLRFGRGKALGAKWSPVVERQGYATPNSIFGPGLVNLDVQLAENFKITQKVDFRIQGQFFNAINHPKFQALPVNRVLNTPAGGHIPRTGNLGDIESELTLRF